MSLKVPKNPNVDVWPFLSLKSYKLVYFYPKDSTPGCTLQAQQFTLLKNQFAKLGVEIFGVSRDSLASHERFIDKCSLKIRLISDSQEELCKAFDVIKEKNMYGKKVMGIERSTFLLDSANQVVREWRKVKADGHAALVLQYIQSEFVA